ncbi:Caulimovirus viroplasmin-domain-containing protein [Scenedesmus sp. NREL 46B-D3]|nr:Caulimovirus viroplasmin-domain-containing protein [Scenedesmus sp. NREL 46B-D3]
MAPKKWYAVRKGHRTGLCESWAECQAATTGYSGAQYKSFKTREEAQAYLTGSSGGAAAAAGHAQPADGGSAAAAAGGKFYAVASGRQIGIFDNWPQTKAAVEGFTNPVYKSFRMRQEAADFLAQYSSSSGGGSRAYGTVRGAADDSAGTAAKRQRGDSYQAPAPPPAFSGKQQQQAAGGQAPSPAAPSALPPQHLFVTTTFDGGSRNNPGRAGYGYAVFERERNERYCLEKLGARHIVARGDSQLVVRQMTGQYRVNGERLLPLYREAKLLQARCESFQIEHIYREENSLADLLSNLAMDSDAAVDRVVHRWQQGAGREELAALLAAGAQVDGHAR